MDGGELSVTDVGEYTEAVRFGGEEGGGDGDRADRVHPLRAVEAEQERERVRGQHQQGSADVQRRPPRSRHPPQPPAAGRQLRLLQLLLRLPGHHGQRRLLRSFLLSLDQSP